jgi:hypothetical protein
MHGLLLLTLGRAEEAGLQFHASEALFPEDPTFKVFQALVAAQQRNFPEATRILKETQAQVGDAQVSLLLSALEVWKSAGNIDEILFGNRQLEFLPFLAKVSAFLHRFLPGKLVAEKPEEVTAISKRLIRLPPAIARDLAQGVTIGLRFATTKTPADRDFTQVGELLKTHPEGTLYYLQATMLMLRGRNREAAEAYRLTAETPALLPFRRPALDGAIMMEGFEGSPLRNKPNLEMRRRAAEHLRERLLLGAVAPNFLEPFCKVALYAGELELGRRVLSQWEKQAPNDVTCLYLSGEGGASGTGIRPGDSGGQACAGCPAEERGGKATPRGGIG